MPRNTQAQTNDTNYVITLAGHPVPERQCPLFYQEKTQKNHYKGTCLIMPSKDKAVKYLAGTEGKRNITVV